MQYSCGNKSFDSKSQIVKYIQNLIQNYNENESMGCDDFNFFMNLLKNHQHYEQKVGAGIKEIKKIRTQYGNHCLQLIRVDDSKTDFSWTKCLTPKNIMDDIRQACRNAIFEDIKKFKDSQYNTDDLPMFPKNKAHVHHDNIGFESIFKAWIKERNIVPENVELIGNEDGMTTKTFKNPELSNDFREFHNKRASIVLMNEDEHLKLKRRTL